jgi:hypothetical protein
VQGWEKGPRLQQTSAGSAVPSAMNLFGAGQRLACSDRRRASRRSPTELLQPSSVVFSDFVHVMEATMHGIIYLVGLIVVILAILSFFGLR